MVQCLHLRILKFPQPHHSSPLHRSSFPVPHVLHCFKWCLKPGFFPGSRGPASSVKYQPQTHRCFQGNSGHPANPTAKKHVGNDTRKNRWVSFSCVVRVSTCKQDTKHIHHLLTTSSTTVNPMKIPLKSA